jgi:hypothetical protein
MIMSIWLEFCNYYSLVCFLWSKNFNFFFLSNRCSWLLVRFLAPILKQSIFIAQIFRQNQSYDLYTGIRFFCSLSESRSSIIPHLSTFSFNFDIDGRLGRSAATLNCVPSSGKPFTSFKSTRSWRTSTCWTYTNISDSVISVGYLLSVNKNVMFILCSGLSPIFVTNYRNATSFKVLSTTALHSLDLA